MPKKIIIDTDPGVDDTMAIFFALRSPELDVIGLTTIFGNVDTALATTNALRLLEIAERTDIPVARGADHPLAVPFGGGVSILNSIRRTLPNARTAGPVVLRGLLFSAGSALFGLHRVRLPENLAAGSDRPVAFPVR